MLLFIVLLSLLGLNLASQQRQQEPRKNFLLYGNHICEGKDAGNYTMVVPYTLNSECDSSSQQLSALTSMILCSGNGQKTVNSLQELAYSIYSDGANYQFEGLFLVLSGNLVGKFIYIKKLILRENYLKKCSSVLGLSYTSTISQVILIADQIELNMFVHPGGGFIPFKKISHTVCQGQSYKI